MQVRAVNLRKIGCCVSQDGPGYAAVTNNPKIFVG